MNFPIIKKTSRGSRSLIFILLLIFGLVFSGVIGFFFTMLNNDAPSSVTNLQIVQICNQILGFMLPPVLYAVLVKEKPFHYLGFKKLQPWSLLGIAAMFTVIPFIATVTEWNDSIVFPQSMKALEEYLRMLNESAVVISEKMMLEGSLFINILIFGAFAAIGEELLFRSVIQESLVKLSKNPHLSIIATALLFSAIHLDFFGLIPRFVLGLMLGYMFWLSGSILPSMLMHFTNNVTIVVLYFLNNKEIIDIDVENFGHTDSVLVILISLITTAAIFVICNRFKNKTIVISNKTE